MTTHRILLLSAYHGDSHKRWCEGLIEQFSDWQWTMEFLPARHFSWRTRGNSLTWGVGDFSNLSNHYDLVVATSMVDLTALRGFRPNLATVPSLVYFHENQFAYPDNHRLQGKVEIQLTSIYTALVADQLVFNSKFNRESFINGAAKLLKKLPDGVPAGLADLIRQKSGVIPVPVNDVGFDCPSVDKTKALPALEQPVNVLWNHRWEWDKGPERLLGIVQVLAEKKLLGRCFKFHIAGQQFRVIPDEFTQIRDILSNHNALGAWGYIKSYQDYQRVMSQCDLVLSTASHDFQGLSMIEAAQHGCIPIAPNDLAYPEWFDQKHLYAIDGKSERKIAQRAVDVLLSWCRLNNDLCGCIIDPPLAAVKFDVSPLTWSELKPKYQTAFAQLLRKSQ